MDIQLEEALANPPQQEIKQKTAEVLVPVNDEGSFSFNNNMELANATTMAIKLRIAPPHLIAEGREAVGAALMFCKQFRLPQKAMGQMAFIKGRIVPFGSLYVALAQRHLDFGDQEEFFIDEKYERIGVENKNPNAAPWAAVIRVQKKNSRFLNETIFSVEDAALAGLLTDKTRSDSTWIKYLKDMLKWKCLTRAYKIAYASTLEGIDCYEDVIEALEKDVTPIDKAAQLNSLFDENTGQTAKQ